MSRRVLLVDDDKNLLRGCTRSLRGRIDLETAPGGEEGLEVLETAGPFAVVVTDMRMPKMDGIAFLEEVSKRSPRSVRMMMTGNSDLQTAITAVNKGNVFRFIAKPCQSGDLVNFLEAGLHQYALVSAERELLEETLQGAIRMCTEMLSLVDARAHGNALEVRDLVREVAGALCIDKAWEIEVAALLINIGHVAIPPVVMTRHRQGANLTGAERDMLARVPVTGYELIRNIPRMENVARILLYNQKRFDGSGVPADSLKGASIPLGSRLLRILSDLVAVQDGMSRSKAVEALAAQEGRYDPELLSRVAGIISPVPSGGKESEAAQLIALSELRAGDVLQSNVETVQGVLVMQAETMLTNALLERVRNFSVLQELREPIRVVRRGGQPAPAL